ncbi:hypothetical protein CEXT_358501 [Caerostris extrusa]|uniref:Uncharacterized protein n=1 Tax=Caerostris extrusa TaxID=172846 RepID=A0AAV4TXK6_CAEEX|nr:hypothetical protein CEXT_358501 [Caerostris extrusa]
MNPPDLPDFHLSSRFPGELSVLISSMMATFYDICPPDSLFNFSFFPFSLAIMVCHSPNHGCFVTTLAARSLLWTLAQ